MFDSLRENFELILVILFIISAVCYVIYRSTFYKEVKADLSTNKEQLTLLSRRERKALKFNVTSSYINTPIRKSIYFFADLFWVLLFVVVVRSFLLEPFIIPSSSMNPGLQINDIVLVNKYEKGLRLPVTNTRLTDGEPVKRGDVIVFKFPENPKISYIKRVIGLPGDKVYYDNRKMTINGQSVPLKELHTESDETDVKTDKGIVSEPVEYVVYEEDLQGYPHTIRYARKFSANYLAREWVVPAGKYLVMGDNRDNSADGRAFGYLDDSLLIGHATRIAFNFDCLKGKGKCDRFFKKID